MLMRLFTFDWGPPMSMFDTVTYAFNKDALAQARAEPGTAPRPEMSAERDDQSYYELNKEFLTFLVGAVAFGLPLVMLISSLFFGNSRYDSISHYYYSRFTGDVFVGALIFIGSFLFAYKGETWWESCLARIAGFASLGVALFPTDGAGSQDPVVHGRTFAVIDIEKGEGTSYVVTDIVGEHVTTAEGVKDFAPAFELTSWAFTLHLASAAVMFVVLAVFCFAVFPRVLPRQRQNAASGKIRLTPQKWRRNTIYFLSGLTIITCVGGLGAKAYLGWGDGWWNQYKLTFWLEAAMLWAFGLSWAVKGKLGPFKNTALGRFIQDPDKQQQQSAAT